MRHRLGRQWTRVLPGVYATFTGQLSGKQRMCAGLLHAGPQAMIADQSALGGFYGVRHLPPEACVRVLIPHPAKVASMGFVIVRRARDLPYPRNYDGLRVCPPEAALVDFALRCRDRRMVRAVVTDAVQRNIAWPPEVARALARAGRRPGRVERRVIAEMLVGIRSAPEAEFADLVRSSATLPSPVYNCLLRLPSGRRISPDALFPQAGLVHETNGRSAHARQDQFESMQERHDAMTAAGLTVLHNSPRRLRHEPAAVLREVEQCYYRLRGRGLPPDVVLERAGSVSP